MARWTGVVVALPSSRPDGLVSRLPAYLHPIAGRPLVWHAVAALSEATSPPERVLVISEGDLSDELFQDLTLPIEVFAVPDPEARIRADLQPLEAGEERCVVVHAAALLDGESLDALVESSPGAWVLGGGDQAAALRSDPDHLPQLFRLPEPFDVPNGTLASADRLDSPAASIVTDRQQLAFTSDRIRRQLVQGLMGSGVSFLLPDTVLVDVDVRVGRDSIVYPGVVLEGATTVGEETVIGPGCRIIDSWIGSGVELRGWNYISHTSIRNRAILEPYVRRGYD